MPMELKAINQVGFILFFRSFIPIVNLSLCWLGKCIKEYRSASVYNAFNAGTNDGVSFMIMDVWKYLHDEMTFKGAGWSMTFFFLE